MLVLIGEGGIGVVYRCWHKIMQREYALKLLKPTQVNEQTWQRFQVEARAIAKLDHPNIVKIYNMGIDHGDCPYYVMELLDGSSLNSYIGSNTLAELTTVLDIFKQLTAGFGYAHSKGIIHRDVKPANVILETDHSGSLIVKIVDFGMAKLLNRDTVMKQGLTSAGEVFGTPLYMSPEQSIGADIDERSDIYSLGCTFFKTLTGEYPFRGESSVETILLHQTQPAPALSDVSDQDFPQPIEDIVQKMLAKRPEDRYQSMKEVEFDIERFEKSQNHSQFTSSQIVTDTEETAGDAPYNLKPLLILGAVTLSILAIGIGTYLLYKNSNPSVSDTTNPADTSASVRDAQLDGSLDTVTRAKPNAYGDIVENLPISRGEQLFNQFKKRASQPAVKNGVRGLKFFFPATSVGRIQNNLGIHAEARGEVFVGETRPICLEIRESDPAVWANPNILEKIDIDNINEIRLSRNNSVEEDPREKSVLAMLKIARKAKNLIGVHFAGFNPGLAVIDYVETFPKLTRFSINNSNESAKDFAKRPFLKKLEYLEVSGMLDVDAVIAALAGSKKLQALIIDETNPSLAALASLKTFPNLVYLSYGSAVITDEQLAAISNIPSLNYFVARRSQCNIESMVKLKGFKRLTEFTIAGWSKEDVARFKKSFPQCKINVHEKSTPPLAEEDFERLSRPTDKE